MMSLLTNSEKRQLQLLDFLNQSTEWWDLDELSAELQVSENKIKKDIEKLKEFSEAEHHLFEILFDPLNGVSLKMKQQISLQLIISRYIKGTVSYQLIDELIQTRHINRNDLAAKLYLSRSSLYRHITQLNQELAKSELGISLRGSDILGEESAIREFIYYFYWSVADDGQWPFRAVTSDMMYMLVKNNADFGHIKYSKIEVIQVMYRLAINFIRHSQKKFISTTVGEEYVDPYRKAYITSVSNLVPTIIPPRYRHNEENFLRLLIVAYPFLDERDLDYQDINRWHQAQNSQAYQLMTEIRQQLVEASTEKDLADNALLEFRLMAVCIYALVFPQLQVQLAATREKNQQFLKQLPVLYEKVKAIVTPEKGSQLPWAEGNDLLLAEVYRVLEKSELINHFQPLLYVKLRCVKSPLTEPDLKRELLKRVKQKLKVDITKDNQAAEFSYDLFISDLSIPYTEEVRSKRVYIWQSQPTARDWEAVEKILAECSTPTGFESEVGELAVNRLEVQ